MILNPIESKICVTKQWSYQHSTQTTICGTKTALLWEKQAVEKKAYELSLGMRYEMIMKYIKTKQI